MLELRPDIRFLSELYAVDAPNGSLLPEYPSSNSDDTFLQNRNRYIIHDPFPPPPRSLLKVLGPHHLMFGWGQALPIASEIPPSDMLLAHWQRALGDDVVPRWQAFDPDQIETEFITLFPHESVPADRQAIDPCLAYDLHSKEVIAKIDCQQAEVLSSATPPYIAKLSHGYAGLGNFYVRDEVDESSMWKQLDACWPGAKLVFNSIIDRVVDDIGVQFYLRRDGSMVWLGFTEQQFDANRRWCGGTFSSDRQDAFLEPAAEIILGTGHYLHSAGYFGVVGIDILRDELGECFLVDVNPRLTGISPFLMASRIFAAEGLTEGVYQASCRFNGTMQELIAAAEAFETARVIVLAAFEEPDKRRTICHLSASSGFTEVNAQVLKKIVTS